MGTYRRHRQRRRLPGEFSTTGQGCLGGPRRVATEREGAIMIWIDKGAAPDVLLGDGKAFQDRAIKFEQDFASVGAKLVKPKGKGRKKKASAMDDDDDSPTSSDHLVSYAKLTSSGGFNGFESKLFSVYSYYSAPDVKARLILSHYGKCAFCESFIMDTDVGDVEHYRPKAEVKENNPTQSGNERLVEDHPGYYWLSQTWENLFLSCKQCNQAFKGNRFDVGPDMANNNLVRDRAGGGLVETALLLNPGVNVGTNPRAVLRFNPDTAQAFVAQSASLLDMPRAQSTITTVGLNRPRLLEARAAHLVRLRSLFILAASGGGWVPPDSAPDILAFQYQNDGPWKHARQALEEAIRPWSEYSALALDAIEQWNTELVMQPTVLNVGFQQAQQQCQVNTQLELGLAKWITLHSDLRVAAMQQVGSQALPDTTTLDVSYNEALTKYKAICKDISVNRRKLARVAQRDIEPLKDRLEQLRQARLQELQKRPGYEDDDDPLFTVEERIRPYEKLRKQGRTYYYRVVRADRLLKGKEDEAYSNLSEQGKSEVLEISRLSNEQRASIFMQAKTQMETNAKILEPLNQELEELKSIAKPFDDEEDDLIEQIDAFESGRSDYFVQLFEVICDAGDAAFGYENCKAPKDRSDRANQLSSSASDMYDFVQSLDDSKASVKSHLGSKAFPPSIRLKS
ncbi:hypothetical protein ACX3YG_07965 [Pseudomonas wadenswilerensis]